MSQTPDSRQQLRDARLENKLRVERLRSHKLAAAETLANRHRLLMESLSVDWVTPYAELLNLTRNTGDPVISGPTSMWQRQQGKNWPIYQTEQELNLLRAPARVLLATNTYAQGMAHGLSAYVISTGCTYRPAKKHKDSPIPDSVVQATQFAVDAILAHNQWHGGEQPPMEVELFERSLEDGEFILSHHPREDGLTDFRAREPEALTQPPGSDWWEYSFGIQTPRDDASNPKKYYLQYGDTPEQGEEYDPEEVTHYRRNVRRSMKRGITEFCFSAYDAIDLADKLRGNLGSASAQQAAIVAVRQHDNGTEQDIQRFAEADAEFTTPEYLTGNQVPTRIARRGGHEDIPKGMNYVAGPGPNNAEAHLSILQACLRGAVVKWNGFEWLISADASNNNYASSLTAESPFVRRVLQEQRGYREAFRKAILFALKHWANTVGIVDPKTGRVWRWDDLKRHLDLLVEAPSPETRNKLEEAQRAQIEIPMGADSRQQYTQRQGRDWDQVQQDNKEYAEQNPQQGQQGQEQQPPQPALPPLQPGANPLESLKIPVVDLDRVLLESGFSGTITDKAGRKRTYQDGKPVASHHDDGGGGDHDSHEIDLGDIEKSPDVAKHPGLLAKIKEHAGRAAKQTAALLTDPKAALYAIAYHTPQILGLWTSVFDHPDDLKKIGYNPSFSGVSGEHHTTADPMKDAVGLPSHMVCGLVIKVGAAAIAAVKDRLAAARTESLESEDDSIKTKATFLHEMLKSIAKELGLNEPPSADEIAEKLSGLGDRAESLLENFTGTDSNGHHWVNGKQVAAKSGGAKNHTAAAKKSSKTAHDVSDSLGEFAKYNPKDGHDPEEYTKPAKDAHKNAHAAAEAAKSGDHALAKEYHKDAAAAHEDAATGHDGYSGTDHRHADAARLHRAAAKKHQAAAQSTGDQSNSSSSPTAAVIDSYQKATGNAKSAMEAALWNAGVIGDDNKPTADAKSGNIDSQKLARTLAGAWREMHDDMTPDERQQVHAALAHVGAKLTGETGEQGRFDGRYQEGPAGLFTGDSVVIVRPGLVQHLPDGKEIVLVKAKTRPASE